MTTYENKGEYVLISPSQSYSLENYKNALKEVLDYCEQNGLTKVLADIRKLEDKIPISDRFEIGVEMARILGNKVQFAILARRDMIDKMGENAAVNRGGQMFVTDSMKKALEWLNVK
jgi:hypothetical protein